MVAIVSAIQPPLYKTDESYHQSDDQIAFKEYSLAVVIVQIDKGYRHPNNKKE
jgi:hypothetical protein